MGSQKIQQSVKGDKQLGWLAKENYYKKGSMKQTQASNSKELTENDLGRLSPEQLRKHKEQLLTDILCGIPESLQIDLDLQDIDTTNTRVKAFFKDTLLRNWCRDVFTFMLALTLIANFVFFVVASYL